VELAGYDNAFIQGKGALLGTDCQVTASTRLVCGSWCIAQLTGSTSAHMLLASCEASDSTCLLDLGNFVCFAHLSCVDGQKGQVQCAVACAEQQQPYHCLLPLLPLLLLCLPVHAGSSMTQKKVDSTFKVTVVLDMQVRILQYACAQTHIGVLCHCKPNPCMPCHRRQESRPLWFPLLHVQPPHIPTSQAQQLRPLLACSRIAVT
jgi:hypothetical protein